MKLIIYYYNLPFTCENVCIELYKFWMDKIIKHKNKKVWLTVSVTLTDNTRFTLIHKLPFNTSDYHDALIILEDRFKSNLLISKADLLDSITFIYCIKEINLESSYITIKKTYILCIFAFLIVISSSLFYYYSLNYSKG